jgi:Asp-tRNA(Asn)/Glu-tRNA(Gln) amidotransferase A subunit family amidase
MLPLSRMHAAAPEATASILEALEHQLGERMETLVTMGLALRDDLEDSLHDNGVLLLPPYSRPAPLHRGSLSTPFDVICAALFNLLEFPVTVVPVGFDPNGLPLAVQVAARRGADHLAIAAARALEDSFGGWVRAEPGEDGGDGPRPELC